MALRDKDDEPNYKFRRDDSGDEDGDSVDLSSDAKSVDLVQCPRCRKWVYEAALRCPKCGHYLLAEEKSRKPLWFVITVIVAVLLVLSWIVGGLVVPWFSRL